MLAGLHEPMQASCTQQSVLRRKRRSLLSVHGRAICSCVLYAKPKGGARLRPHRCSNRLQAHRCYLLACCRRSACSVSALVAAAPLSSAESSLSEAQSQGWKTRRRAQLSGRARNTHRIATHSNCKPPKRSPSPRRAALGSGSEQHSFDKQQRRPRKEPCPPSARRSRRPCAPTRRR